MSALAAFKQMTSTPLESPQGSQEIPEFLIRSTLGCSLVIFAILIPFTITNFLFDRLLMVVATLLSCFACGVNVWLGLRGKYSVNVNLFLVAPTGAITITYAVFILGAQGSYWSFLLILAFYFILPEQRAWVVNSITLVFLLPVSWLVLDTPSSLRFSAAIIGTSLFAFISMREINLLHQLLKERAVTDCLTGVYNRSLLVDSLEQALAQFKRLRTPMTIISLDLDYFKSINDQYGHAGGDQVLIEFGALLKARIRKTDKAFRTGGEEFLIIVFNADKALGVQIAEKIRKDANDLRILEGIQFSFSAGVSQLDDDDDVTSWLKRCDIKLYEAKHSGRNRVVS